MEKDRRVAANKMKRRMLAIDVLELFIETEQSGLCDSIKVYFILCPLIWGVDSTVLYWLRVPFSARLFLDEIKKSAFCSSDSPSYTYWTVSSIEKRYCGLIGQTGMPRFALDTRSINNRAPSLILSRRLAGHSIPKMKWFAATIIKSRLRLEQRYQGQLF